MITKELQQRILEALQQSRENFTGSDSKFSISIGINAAQYSRIKNGDTERGRAFFQTRTPIYRLG